MKVAIIGTGNVASVIARLIKSSDHSLIHIAGRTLLHAQALATQWQTSFSTIDDMPQGSSADIYIITVSDKAINECAVQLKVSDAIVLHTAGAVSKDILKNHAERYGILYPLQSLTKDMQATKIPLLIDGNTNEVVASLREFALSLSSDVHIANDEERLKLHTAAVVVSNFTNHLYALAETFCIKEKVEFDLLKPLILETAARLKYNSPSAVQTGPASRKDLGTIALHLQLLNEHPQLKKIYEAFSKSIME